LFDVGLRFACPWDGVAKTTVFDCFVSELLIQEPFPGDMIEHQY
jgi:hypothetical protein